MTTTYIQLTQDQLDQLTTDAVQKAIKTSEAQKRAHLLDKVQYYTTEQAAAMIGVTVETVRKYARQGRLKKRGGTSTAQFHIEDVEMFIWRQRGTKVPQKP